MIPDRDPGYYGMIPYLFAIAVEMYDKFNKIEKRWDDICHTKPLPEGEEDDPTEG